MGFGYKMVKNVKKQPIYTIAFKYEIHFDES